jgi:hypothetical protein
MALDTTSPRSRRALLAAAAGAAAATVAGAVVPRAAVEAANNDPLLVGNLTNAATAETQLHVTGTAGNGLVVFAETTTALAAVAGHNPENYGVYGNGHAAGVFGESINGTGVGGSTGDGIGVGGSSYGTIGVEGATNSGTGVFGKSEGTGTGVRAESASGTALSVSGKAHFSRSGRKTILAGHSTVTITLAGTTTGSKVFAVLASNRASRYVRAVVPSTGSFKVYLNATVSSTSTIAWFVLD